MTEPTPAKTDNRLATGITVGAILALLVAVGLATFGDLSPPESQNASEKASQDASKDTRADHAAAVRALDEKTGEASWYDFEGERTANGETMDADRLTAAHPTLPLGTKLKVENQENDRTVVVRINDRGPFADGRIIDLSEAAAEELGMTEDGVAEVHLKPVREAVGGVAKSDEAKTAHD